MKGEEYKGKGASAGDGVWFLCFSGNLCSRFSNEKRFRVRSLLHLTEVTSVSVYNLDFS